MPEKNNINWKINAEITSAIKSYFAMSFINVIQTIVKKKQNKDMQNHNATGTYDTENKLATYGRMTLRIFFLETLSRMNFELYNIYI